MSEKKHGDDGSKLIELLKAVLTDVRLILLLIVGIFLSGFAAYGQVQTLARSEAKAEAQAQVAGLDASVKAISERLDAHVLDSKMIHQQVVKIAEDSAEESRATRKEVEALRADLRRVFPMLPPLDGGAP